MSCKDGPDFGPKKLEFQYQVTLPVFTLTPDKIQNFSIQIKYEMQGCPDSFLNHSYVIFWATLNYPLFLSLFKE